MGEIKAKKLSLKEEKEQRVEVLQKKFFATIIIEVNYRRVYGFH